MYKTKINQNKKGFVEITSFALLTGLILVTSLIAYLVITNIIDDKISEFDRDSMETNLKKLKTELDQINSFTGSSFSSQITLKKGALEFKQNNLTYKSFVKYSTTEISCFNGLCYNSQNGFETITLNLDNITFSNNFSLTPNSYIIQFTNTGGGNIDVKFK